MKKSIDIDKQCMANLDSKIIASINLASKYPSIRRAGIFDSYAKGEQTENSDIDNYFEDLQNSLGKIDFIPYNGLINSNESVRK